MPNQRQIARVLGLSQATVSLAMRGHPSISEKTRDAVLAAAQKMGYRSNPMVSSLMEHIRTGRVVQNQGCIAILYDTPSNVPFSANLQSYSQQMEGFYRQAVLRGYRAECFYLRDPGMSPEAMDRLLYARGITGIILAVPKEVDSPPIAMQWERYACSTVGYSWRTPLVDRVSSHHRHNVDLAFQNVLERGYQRIGMILPHAGYYGVDSNWLAGFLVGESHLPKSRRIPLFAGSIRDTDISKFKKWFDRWKPDALITIMGEELAWLREMGLSRGEVGLACLNLLKNSPLSGIVENNRSVGEIACEIVVNKLLHNERGIPTQPHLTLIDGTWVDGNSLPRKIQKRTGRSKHSAK